MQRSKSLGRRSGLVGLRVARSDTAGRAQKAAITRYTAPTWRKGGQQHGSQIHVLLGGVQCNADACRLRHGVSLSLQ
jgi:hypothetical protein